MATGRKISIIVDEQGANRVAKNLNKVNTIGDKVTAGFKRLTTGIGAFTKKALITTAAIAGLAYGASRLARAVFTPFMNLEYTMARVRVAEGATIEQTKALTEVAGQLGRDTLYSASQAAEGMLFLAKAGLNVKQTMEAIPGVLQAAIVENLDLGTAADIVTGLLNEFALSADKAGVAADVLAKGSNLAKTNMPEMSEALKYFGATAHELGYDIQYSVAMLDVLAGKMIRGTMAGTAMRQSMILFQKIQAAGTFTTKAQTDAIGRLGLNANKLAKQISAGDLTFIKFLSTLKKAGATTGDFASIFEQRAAVGVNALAEAADTAFPEYVDQLDAAVGFTKEAGGILEDTLWGQTQQIKSSIETMTNALATTFAPGLRDFLQFQLRPKINEITEAWQKGGDTWQEKLKNVWTTQLGPMMESGLQGLIDSIGTYTPKIASTMGDLGAALIPAFAKGIWEGMKSLGAKMDTYLWEGMKQWIPSDQDWASMLHSWTENQKNVDYYGSMFGPRFTPGPSLPDQSAKWQTLAGLPPLPGQTIAPPGPIPWDMAPATSSTAPLLSFGGGAFWQPFLSSSEALLSAQTVLNEEADLLRNTVKTEIAKVQANQKAIEDKIAETNKFTADLTSQLATQFVGGQGGQWISDLLGPGAASVISGTLSGLTSETGVANIAESGLGAATETAFAAAGGWPAILASVLLKVFLPALGDLLTSIFGSEDKLRGRSASTGAFAYANGGIARTPQLAMVAENGPEMMLPVSSAGSMGGTSIDASVHIENLSVAGEDADEITYKFKQEIREAQEYASRQMARQMKQGMVKREAMER